MAWACRSSTSSSCWWANRTSCSAQKRSWRAAASAKPAAASACGCRSVSGSWRQHEPHGVAELGLDALHVAVGQPRVGALVVAEDQELGHLAAAAPPVVALEVGRGGRAAGRPWPGSSQRQGELQNGPQVRYSGDEKRTTSPEPVSQRRAPMATATQPYTQPYAVDPIHSSFGFALPYQALDLPWHVRRGHRVAQPDRRGRRPRGRGQGRVDLDPHARAVPPARPRRGLLRRRQPPRRDLPLQRPRPARGRHRDRARPAHDQGRHAGRRRHRHLDARRSRTPTATSATGFALEADIDRTAFGINWNMALPNGGRPWPTPSRCPSTSSWSRPSHEDPGPQRQPARRVPQPAPAAGGGRGAAARGGAGGVGPPAGGAALQRGRRGRGARAGARAQRRDRGRRTPCSSPPRSTTPRSPAC